MKHLILFVMSFFLLFSCQERQKTAAVAGEETLDIPPCVVTSPPDSLKLDKFYKKYVGLKLEDYVSVTLSIRNMWM